MQDIDEKQFDNAVEILKALSHPVRLRIIKILIDKECNVTNLEKNVGLSQSGVSQHLRILRLSGLIEPERDGKKICYRIKSDKTKAIVKTLLS